MSTITFKSEGYDEELRGAAFVHFVKQMKLSPSAHVVLWLAEAGDDELYEHAALPEALRALDNGLRPSAVFHLEAGTMPSSVRGVVLRMARQGRVSSFTTDDPDFFMQLLRTPTVSLPAVCLAWQIELENFDTDLLIKALERFIARNRSARRIELRRVCYVNLPENEDHQMPKRFVDWVMQTLPGLILRSAGAREIKLGMVSCINYDFYRLDEYQWPADIAHLVAIDEERDTLTIARPEQ